MAQGTYKDLMMKSKILTNLVSSNAQQSGEHQTDHLSNWLDNVKIRKSLNFQILVSEKNVSPSPTPSEFTHNPFAILETNFEQYEPADINEEEEEEQKRNIIQKEIVETGSVRDIRVFSLLISFLNNV